MGKKFSEKHKQVNPIIRAADNNGYFQCQSRWQSVYGAQFWKVFSPASNPDVPDDGVSFFRWMRENTKKRKPINSDNVDLYLANINGWEILEGRYLLGARGGISTSFSLAVASAFILLIFVSLVIYINPVMLLYLSTWAMMISWILLSKEAVSECDFIGGGVSSGTIQADLMRWRIVDNVKDHVDTFVKNISKAMTSLLVAIPVLIIVVGFLIFSTMVSKALFIYVSDHDHRLMFYFKESFLGYFPQLVFTTIFSGIALLMSFSREFRRERIIFATMNHFEEGRREYDRYYLCKVLKDREDGEKWINFYYDQAFEQFARDYYPHQRYAEQPVTVYHGFGAQQNQNTHHQFPDSGERLNPGQMEHPFDQDEQSPYLPQEPYEQYHPGTQNRDSNPN